MEFNITYYNGAEELLSNNELYNWLLQVLEGIEESELIDIFSERKKKFKREKSLSPTIGFIINEHIKNKPGWEINKPIFKKNFARERNLSFVSEDLAVEIGFNHCEAIEMKLLKLQLSIAPHEYLEKAINPKVGILISATNDMEDAGNFDSASGSYENIKGSIITLGSVLKIPFVLIGFKAPKTFYINKNKEVIIINE